MRSLLHPSSVLASVLAFALAIGCTPPVDAPPPGVPGDDDDTSGDDDDDDDTPCTAGNTRPQTPTVLEPANGAVDAVPANLVITASSFVDAEGDAHRATRFEIVRVKGTNLELAWELETDDPAKLKSVTLADGAFLDDHAETNTLREDEDYLVRVAFRDDSGACNDWSITSDGVAFHTDDGSTFLFDEDQVLTFEIDIPPESFELINAQAPSPGCVQYLREYYPGTFRFTPPGSDTPLVFDGVGVRTKGGCGSSRTLDGKASLKVNLSWDNPSVEGCPETRRLFGQKTLTFNNGVQDRTAAHERLGYELYRAAGVPAPRAVTVQLIVNGEPWGVYTMVESFSRRMLSRFYANNDGMMYEGAYWCDLVPENVPATVDEFSCFAREFEEDACDAVLDPEQTAARDPTDFELLRTLAEELRVVAEGESFYPEVEALIDMDEFLSMWAVDTVISHWDAYSFTIINNYRVYRDPDTDRWSVFPWGIDQTFDGGGDQDPFESDALLVTECRDDPECTAAFAQRLDEVVALFESLDLATKAQAIHDQIQPFVYADPRKEYGNEEWENRHADLQDWIAGRPERVRERLEDLGFSTTP